MRWSQPVSEPKFAAFAAWVERFKSGAGSEEEGINLATARREELARLIRENPQRALELAVPASVRGQLPAAVLALLEQPIDGRGDLTLMAALPEPGKAPERPANSRYAIVDGQKFNAFVFGRRLGQPTRWDIPLHGVALGKDVALDDSPVRVLEPAEAAVAKAALPADPVCSFSGLVTTANNSEVALDVGGSTIFLCSPEHAAHLAASLAETENLLPIGAGDPAKSNTTDYRQNGNRKILLIRVDFSDYPGGSMTDTEGTNCITSLVNTFSNWSYGRLIVADAGAGSDVTPVLRMPQSNAGYNGNDGQLQTDARAAALSNGFDYATYDLDAVCFAGNTPNWGYGGLAYVGTRGVWLHTTGLSGNAGIGTHEFGHNFGLNHANYYNAPFNSVIAGGGSNDEYGDPFDTMGSASTNNTYSARQKQYLGWLTNGGGLTEWVSVTSGSTTNRVYAHDEVQAPGLLKGIRITRDTGLANDKIYYWVEYRTTKTNHWLDNGAGLRWAGSGNERPELLDTTPETLYGKDDSSIAIGRTYSDTNYDIHITPIGKGGTTPQSLDVVVNYGPFPGNQPPTLALTAPATNAATGVSLSFTATASDPDGDDLAYYWNFGDGSAGDNNQTNISHSWSSTGNYVVQCTVSDMKGRFAMNSVLVKIGNPNTYTISGNVRLHDLPVANVRVAADSTHYAYSDSDGTYTITGFANGTTNTLSASLESHNFITDYGSTNRAVVGPSTNNLNFLGGVPLLNGLVARTMNWNTTNTPMFFWTYDFENAGSNLMVSAFSGNTNLMPDSGITLSTTGTNRILTLKPATNQSGTVTNFIVVADLDGYSKTNTFVLTINQPPVLTTTSATGAEDNAIDIDLWSRSTDNNPVSTADSNTLFTVTGASNGTVTLLTNRTAHFVPNVDYFGPASFTFTATDKGYDPTLLLYYDFDSGSSNDRSGNARTATLDKDGTGNYQLVTNAAPPSLAPFDLVTLDLTDNGNSNSARLYRTIPSGEYNFNNADWTFACWFRRDTVVNDDLLFHIGIGDAAGNDGHELYAYLATSNNSVRLRHYDASSVLDMNLSTPATALPNEWHHLAVTFDRTNSSKGDFKLYFDGALAASTNGITLGMTQTNIVFGGHDNTNNTHRWFSGALDEVAVWKVALTSNQVDFLQDHIVAHLGGLSRSTNISLTFTAVNDAPTLSSIGNYQIPEDSFAGPIAFTIGDVETPASNLVVSVSSSNTNLVPNATNNLVLGGSDASRTLRIYPATNQNGVATITVSTGDGVAVTNRSFTFTVTPVNDPPTLLPLPAHYTYPGVPVSFVVSATDLETNTCMFSLVNPPAGATVDAATGLITWTPDNSQLGNFVLLARATDNGAPNLSGTNGYSITVFEAMSKTNVMDLVNGDWTISWNSIPGRTYRVQYKDSLYDATWSDLPGDVIATGTVSSKTDAVGALTCRFYQILLLP
ncbi:MAG TPA: LamG-like jellyroll fold domain-containing protein [Verrucomicrobiae bacterium]